MDSPAGVGLFSSFQGLLATLLEVVHTRVALLATELEEEKLRLLKVLTWGALAVLLGCVGVVFLAGFVTVLLWQEHRLAALGVTTALFLAACGVAVWRVAVNLKAAKGLLVATLAELDHDRKALLSPARAESSHLE